MVLLTMTFWLRLLAVTIAIGFVSSVVTLWGGAGTGGFTHDGQATGLFTFLPCAIAATVSVAMLALIGSGRVARLALVRR